MFTGKQLYDLFPDEDDPYPETAIPFEQMNEQGQAIWHQAAKSINVMAEEKVEAEREACARLLDRIATRLHQDRPARSAEVITALLIAAASIRERES